MIVLAITPHALSSHQSLQTGVTGGVTAVKSHNIFAKQIYPHIIPGRAIQLLCSGPCCSGRADRPDQGSVTPTSAGCCRSSALHSVRLVPFSAHNFTLCFIHISHSPPPFDPLTHSLSLSLSLSLSVCLSVNKLH